MGQRGPKPVDQNKLEFWYGAWLRVFDGMCTGRYINKELDFKDEHTLWLRLLHATMPEEVRTICDESEFWLNPKRGATLFHDVLSQQAQGFLDAKQDPRWPKSDRPTSRGRRNRFLARSMAGISMGISIRTAQDLLAKKEKKKLEAIYRPICVCGHRERDHKDRKNCKYCSCVAISIPVETRSTGRTVWSLKHPLDNATGVFALKSGSQSKVIFARTKVNLEVLGGRKDETKQRIV